MKWFFGLIVAVGLIGAILDVDTGETSKTSDSVVVESTTGTVVESTTETSSSAPPATIPTTEISQAPPVLFPDGYQQVSNEFAMMSIKKGEPGWDCDVYDYCVNWNLYSIFGCPNGGYVEANIIEESGTIVSYTNDLIPSMSAGDTYRTVLGGFGEGGKLFKLTEISCN